MFKDERRRIDVDANTMRMAFCLAMHKNGVEENQAEKLGGIFDDFLEILGDPEELEAINKAARTISKYMN